MNIQKRILLVLDASSLEFGAVHSVISLASELHKSVSYEPVVVMAAHGDAEEALRDIDVKYYIVKTRQKCHSRLVNSRSWKNIAKKVLCPIEHLLNENAVYEFKKIIEREHIELVHICSLPSSCAAGIAAVRMGKKLIWHAREFYEEDLGATFVDKRYTYKIINESNLILAISEAVKCKWEKTFRAPMDVVYNGVEVRRYYIDHSVKQDYPINIIMYSRIAENKGQLEYLRALKVLLNESGYSAKIKVFWAGYINDRDYYEKCMSEINSSPELKSCTEYLGPLKEIKKTLSKMQIVCVCSKSEAFGRVTAEGMLAKCLVIGANTGGTSELIKDGENGLLYNYGSPKDLSEKIKWAIDNIQNISKIAENGQEFALENFTSLKNAKEIMKRYNEILSE